VAKVVPGVLKGLGVTFKELTHTITPKRLGGGAATVQYPHEKEAPPTRARGVIALKEENCTMCMLCARECPDWCIYIEGHKERRESRGEGKRAKAFNVLDRFAIDYALCMYCGICVEVCPYDALFWSPEFEYAEGDITRLTHEMERLEDWMRTVLPPSPLDDGAKGPEIKSAAPAAPAPAAAPAAAAPAPVETAPGPPPAAARPVEMSEAEFVEQLQFKSKGCFGLSGMAAQKSQQIQNEIIHLGHWSLGLGG